MNIPDDCRYSSDHEWVRLEQANRARVGITDYAQDALGDVVYVELPEVGLSVSANQSICEVESTKSVSDIYAPVAGSIIEVNTDLADSPELMNSDPYGEGWMFIVEVQSPSDLDGLLDVAGYQSLTEA